SAWRLDPALTSPLGQENVPRRPSGWLGSCGYDLDLELHARSLEAGHQAADPDHGDYSRTPGTAPARPRGRPVGNGVERRHVAVAPLPTVQ
ncbi:MAG: hypothetical protein ACJ8H8_14040, partial [Geminicoccaceae bacterium]